MGKHTKEDAYGTCGGEGEVPITSDGRDERGTHMTVCPICRGSGSS